MVKKKALRHGEAASLNIGLKALESYSKERPTSDIQWISFTVENHALNRAEKGYHNTNSFI
jgi:hypothetical protein